MPRILKRSLQEPERNSKGRRRHFFMVVADVTAELEGVCMQGQGDEAARALRRPAALFAERRRRAPARVEVDDR